MSIPIQRQYSSPNCVLSLHGFSDDSSPGDGILVMSVLTEAKCQFVGVNKTLTGGVNFVNNLVKAVSAYGQSLLSGLTHSWETVDDSDYIFLHKIPEKNRHVLVWQEKKEDSDNKIEIELSTVQLFDLLETVDQFCADKSTLPNLEDNLTPLSRRYRQIEVSLVEQSTPAAVGLAAFALSAIALFLIPYPTEIRDPNQEIQTPIENNTEEIVPELPIEIPFDPEDVEPEDGE